MSESIIDLGYEVVVDAGTGNRSLRHIEFTEPGSCPVCGSVGGDHDDECPKITGGI